MPRSSRMRTGPLPEVLWAKFHTRPRTTINELTPEKGFAYTNIHCFAFLLLLPSSIFNPRPSELKLPIESPFQCPSLYSAWRSWCLENGDAWEGTGGYELQPPENLLPKVSGLGFVDCWAAKEHRRFMNGTTCPSKHGNPELRPRTFKSRPHMAPLTTTLPGSFMFGGRD